MRKIIRKTILLFIALSITFCLSPDDYDFKTSHGVKVWVGIKNQPKQEDIERWTDITIKFWKDINPNWIKCIDYVVPSLLLHYKDQYKFVLENGTIAAGYAQGSFIAIGLGNPNNDRYTEVCALTIHEISHPIVGECGGDWGQDSSHKVFTESGLSNRILKVCYGK